LMTSSIGRLASSRVDAGGRGRLGASLTGATAGPVALLAVAGVVGATDDTESSILGIVADIGTSDRSEVESQAAIHRAAINTITIRGTKLRRSDVEFGSLPGARPECPHLDQQRKRRSTDLSVYKPNSATISASEQLAAWSDS
jgi:hypothetical protein